MSLIPKVGKKSVRLRGLIAVIYGILIFGAITTLYPFTVMIGTSMTNDYDQAQYKIIPSYLISLPALEAKYAEDKYNGNLQAISNAYQTDYVSLQTLSLPVNPASAALVPKWHSFFASLPLMYKQPGFRGASGQYVPSKLLNEYRDWVSAKYHGDIDVVSKTYLEEDTSFLNLYPPFERPTQRLFLPGESVKDKDWAEFQKSLPENWMMPILCDPLYQNYLHDEVYQSGKIDDLNTVWHTHYTNWHQVTLPMFVSEAPYRPDWENFVRHKLPLRYVDFVAHEVASSNTARPHSGRIATAAYPWLVPRPDLPRPFFGMIHPLLLPGASGDAIRDAENSVNQMPAESLGVVSLDNLWRAQPGMANAPIPLAEDDREYADSNAGPLRSEFMWRNYKFATDFLLLHGRGMFNTVVYCAGAVLVAIIINPLCAYALSRFKLKQTNAILLFMLATMAFPAEVTMIPSFLLVKQMGLLNTFWALILPGAASGFSIFLLKGFFDSLPPELYEAGMIDGASELTLFSKVTLPLSKPIFAYIALGAFTSMYGSFMFALTTEQAQSQWPLMVWIYELQALSAPSYAMMAALMVAALPTLIVFMFAQNVIMKGIILPSYK